MSLSPRNWAALDIAIETLKRSRARCEAADLLALRERSWPWCRAPKAVRLETDHEALLEAQGLAARPGPRQRIDRKIGAAIAEAVKGLPHPRSRVSVRGDPAPRTRRLAPYGLLTGLRQYLVARPAEARSGSFRLYVVEKIRSAKVSGEAFERDPAFNLQFFANRAFGVFQNEEEFGEVVWRFSPRAAPHARGFEFHPASGHGGSARWLADRALLRAGHLKWLGISMPGP